MNLCTHDLHPIPCAHCGATVVHCPVCERQPVLCQGCLSNEAQARPEPPVWGGDRVWRNNGVWWELCRD